MILIVRSTRQKGKRITDDSTELCSEACKPGFLTKLHEKACNNCKGDSMSLDYASRSLSHLQGRCARLGITIPQNIIDAARQATQCGQPNQQPPPPGSLRTYTSTVTIPMTGPTVSVPTTIYSTVTYTAGYGPSDTTPGCGAVPGGCGPPQPGPATAPPGTTTFETPGTFTTGSSSDFTQFSPTTTFRPTTTGPIAFKGHAERVDPGRVAMFGLGVLGLGAML